MDHRAQHFKTPLVRALICDVVHVALEGPAVSHNLLERHDCLHERVDVRIEMSALGVVLGLLLVSAWAPLQMLSQALLVGLGLVTHIECHFTATSVPLPCEMDMVRNTRACSFAAHLEPLTGTMVTQRHVRCTVLDAIRSDTADDQKCTGRDWRLNGYGHSSPTRDHFCGHVDKILC